MAQRRMFSLKIIDTDLFLDMPLSTQALYFHLSMRADDDGFIGNHKKIMRMIGASDDDMRVLIAKGLLIPFESGVCVIKHWRIHNYIRSDRYTPTFYEYEKSQIVENANVYDLDTEGIQNVIPNVNQMGDNWDTQVRLGKDRLELGKDSLELGKDSLEIDNVSEDTSVNKFTPIIEGWNKLNLSKIISIKGNRLNLLNARIKEYGLDKILQAIDNINESSFLKGQNDRGWTITFDWFIKPNNFVKVLENNYIDRKENKPASNVRTKKTKFHNFDESVSKYSADELNNIIARNNAKF